jgi:hypothetical protein
LKSILTEIKEIFKFNADLTSLASYLRKFQSSSKDECERAMKEVEQISHKCEELKAWKRDQEVKNSGHAEELMFRC